MDDPLTFGEWLKCRRKELDLTQNELARRASSSVFTIRKIEIGERRPSRQLAELLAKSIGIPPEHQNTFIKVARGELNIERLYSLLPGPVSPPAEPPTPTPGNLPRVLTPFIGREAELTALDQLLQDPHCSLLTIVGPGGIGKTRLAIEAAQQAKSRFADGVWFIPLVSLNSPALIVPAIAEAIHFKFQDPTNLEAQLIRYLRLKKALLVLDNLEHLLEGVGVFADILQDCPQVKLLVTSRERLNLSSEWVFEIQGLPVPPHDRVEQFDSYSSVALFLQSARRVRAGFELRETERPWVQQICQTMGGMPLGIELSAAWVGLLSCEEIAQEIQHNLDFLSASMRDLPERHRSLRATLDHSWKLLAEDERLVLSRLSVFHGSFSREAAQEICETNLAILSALRNKSLLQRTEQGEFVLHEMIRQYAGRKLAEHPDENERTNTRHAAYYVQCLANWEKALQGARQLETFDEMARVIGNLSQAWRYMITHCHPGTGISNQLCADLLHSALFSLSLFYEQHCRNLEAITLFKESVEYLKAVQPEFEGTEDLSRFISVLGHITAYLGLHFYATSQFMKAREYLEAAIQLLENSQSRVEKAQAQVMLASIYMEKGQLQDAEALLKQGREVFQEEGIKWWYALSTVHLAIDFLQAARYSESEALFWEAYPLVDPGDLRTGLQLRSGLNYILYIKNDLARAEQMYKEGLQLSYQFGNAKLTSEFLFDLGRVALAAGQIDLAIENIQKSLHLRTEFGESRDLGLHWVYLGKCFVARGDFQAARDQFRQVIQYGQEVDNIGYIYGGLLNIARTYAEEGLLEKALEISLLLGHCSIEYGRFEEERCQLFADLQAALPIEQVEAAAKQINAKISPDQAGADTLAYALKLIAE